MVLCCQRETGRAHGGRGQRAAAEWRWQAGLEWKSGEVFWQPLYLRAGGQTVRAEGVLDERRIGVASATVRFPGVGEVEASVLISADDFVIARVPEDAVSGPVVVGTNGHVSNAQQIKVAGQIADNLREAPAHVVGALGLV